MWIHWPFFFPKTWTKGHWPLDNLWPHVCWGHMCDSIQGSLCPSPMTIHQCMWIQWSILQNTTYILHTTYILRTYYVQNEWSHSLLLNSVQARQKTLRNGSRFVKILQKTKQNKTVKLAIVCERKILTYENERIDMGRRFRPQTAHPIKKQNKTKQKQKQKKYPPK